LRESQRHAHRPCVSCPMGMCKTLPLSKATILLLNSRWSLVLLNSRWSFVLLNSRWSFVLLNSRWSFVSYLTPGGRPQTDPSSSNTPITPSKRCNTAHSPMATSSLGSITGGLVAPQLTLK
jgi:hypothetical protein